MAKVKFSTIARELKEQMILEKGYLSCEHCGVSNSPFWDCHHIILRSEAPKHPNLHNPLNLIIVCRECHQWFHAKKRRREYLIEERRLWNLFEHIKEYESPNNERTKE